jgi:glutathione S-transferase
VLVPRLTHEGTSVWDTLAIAEYLGELYPAAQMLPADRLARAHCRSVAGEIHSGFTNLRSALPMNLKVRHASFPIFSGAKPDIERVEAIWQDCLLRYGGPFLFGALPTVADAMYAPVTTRFQIAAAKAEPEEMEELEVEF